MKGGDDCFVLTAVACVLSTFFTYEYFKDDLIVFQYPNPKMWLCITFFLKTQRRNIGHRQAGPDCILRDSACLWSGPYSTITFVAESQKGRIDSLTAAYPTYRGQKGPLGRQLHRRVLATRASGRRSLCQSPPLANQAAACTRSPIWVSSAAQCCRSRPQRTWAWPCFFDRRQAAPACT